MTASDSQRTTNAPTIVARSQVMHDLLDLARRAAASDATVLIHGETGTGKELIARTIHNQSKRNAEPFVPVNCGAYTDSLLASELFGHVRGAFTGAFADRAGVFEAANGGTVFLDEIAAMSPAMQVKVLRVLQEQRVLRVGASREIDVNVRVVAATNADLPTLARTGQFREDLYYRIKVVACDIPPLRERREDIIPLAEHFLNLYAKNANRPPMTLAPDTQAALLAHDWPGNVRQLQAEMEQLVAMAAPTPTAPESTHVATVDRLSREVRGGQLPNHLHTTYRRPTAFPNHSQSPSLNPDTGHPATGDNIPEAATYQELLDVFTRKVIADRLARFDGNISQTAKSLAISRSTLYALLKKYDLQ